MEGSESLPPCFVPVAPDDEPLLSLETVKRVEREQPCFLNGFNEGRAKMFERVSTCLTPQRSGPSPQRAVYLIGDSHANSLSEGLMASLDGAASVVWAAMGAGCGWVSARVRQAEYQCREDDCSDSDGAQNCEAYNEAIVAVFEQVLQPCDTVVLHNARGKYGGTDDDPWLGDWWETYDDQAAHVRTLQAIVTSKGASLVLVGDGIELPSEPSYCIPTPFAPDAMSQCTLEYNDANDFDEYELYRELAGQESTYFMELAPLMCTPIDGGPRQRCDATVPGTDTISYHDTGHLSSAGSLYLWPFLCDFFASHGLLGA